MPGRNDWFTFPQKWLECKRAVDKVDPELWRIHDKLYDLKDFAAFHPGGAQWIQLTKGTDITEAFEVSHLFDEAYGASMLKKFYVCNSPYPRTSKFTFATDGFYKTLKRKAVPVLKKVGTGPSSEMRFIQGKSVNHLFRRMCKTDYFNYFIFRWPCLSLQCPFYLNCLESISSHCFDHNVGSPVRIGLRYEYQLCSQLHPSSNTI